MRCTCSYPEGAAECGLPAVWFSAFRLLVNAECFFNAHIRNGKSIPSKRSHSCAKVGTHVVRFPAFAAEMDCTLKGICLFRISGVEKAFCIDQEAEGRKPDRWKSAFGGIVYSLPKLISMVVAGQYLRGAGFYAKMSVGDSGGC